MRIIRINRLSLKDWIVNLWLRYRFNKIRKNDPEKLKNFSYEDKDGYELTFVDNFNSVSWGRGDLKKQGLLWGIGEDWGPFHPGWPNKYFGEPKLGDDSCAIFYAKYAPKKFIHEGEEIEIPYVVSWLNTVHTFRQQYGRFECRMTLPKEKGTWPAFWLWGPTWPPEIDVIEAYGRETGEDIVYQEINIHWRNKKGKRRHVVPWKIKIDDYDENISERFHEFVLEWNPDGMYFYTDGVLVFQYTNKRVLDFMFNKEGVEPFMLVNQNIMKNIDGSEGDNYYSEFKVDYVRAYKKFDL